MPIFLNRSSVHVYEVQHPAVFAIPPSLPHPVEHTTTGANQFFVSTQFAFVHDEPSTFDRVPWIQRATVEMVENLAVETDCFHHTLNVWFEMETTDVSNTPINKLVRFPQRNRFSQLLCGDNSNHRKANPTCGAGISKLGLGTLRGEIVLYEATKRLFCFLCVPLLAGCFCQLAVRDCGETLRECVSSFANRFSFASNVKPHAPINWVEAVLVDELSSVLCQFQPVLAFFNVVVEFA